MKTTFKKLFPAFVLVLGSAGAFATMSMQKAETLTITGYAENPQTHLCNVPVSCETFGSEMCRVSYPSGAIAKDKPASVCLDALWRP